MDQNLMPPTVESLIQEIKTLGQFMAELRDWSETTSYGYASDEVRDLLVFYGYAKPTDNAPLPAERQFDSQLFTRGHTLEDVSRLGEIFAQAVTLLNQLQIPPDPDEKESYWEMRNKYKSLVSDIILALTGKEWEEWHGFSKQVSI